MKNKNFKIAILGRANVGKSTLFNRLTGKRGAIISDIPGTTRDRNYATTDWQGVTLTLIDTGGLDFVHQEDLKEAISKQTLTAAKEADLILVLTDAKTGILPQDKDVAKIAKSTHKPVVLAVNKADNKRLRMQTTNFFQLGLGTPWAISAANGAGTGDLLDELVEKAGKLAPKQKDVADEPEKPPIKIAIIGQPNVGKSSLINALLGEERLIASPMPYTTRDAQVINFTYNQNHYQLIDTAGIRRNRKVGDKLEKYSVEQAELHLKQAQVALLVTDVSVPLNGQDSRLGALLNESRASSIIIANKWDLIEEKDEHTLNKFTTYYRNFFPHLVFSPIIFTSAINKQRVRDILDVAKTVYDERFRVITDNALDKFLKHLIKKQPPAKTAGRKHTKIYQIQQVGTNPLRFDVVKDLKVQLSAGYIKYMEKELRAKFGFQGCPMYFSLREPRKK
jgi:GTP-binding protein